MTLVYHDCACCGSSAGKWEQWHNQDHEYGVCTSCAVWIADREGWTSVFDCYGIPGRNWNPPTTIDFRKAKNVTFESFVEAFNARYSQPYAGKITKGAHP